MQQGRVRWACQDMVVASDKVGNYSRMAERYRTFAEFYPFYLTEHVNVVSRRLHVIGTTLVVASLIAAAVLLDWRFLAAAPVIGYGFAWVGHFFFEKNQPATFKYPGFSLMGDFRLWWEVVTLQRKF
jgi:hypothetical protein